MTSIRPLGSDKRRELLYFDTLFAVAPSTREVRSRKGLTALAHQR